MRADYPREEGFVENDGVKVGYEVFGSGPTTVLLLPTWTIIHSHFWKLQVPYLARRHRVVTFDGPGNGRSDRPLDTAAYGADAVARHAVSVLDATGTERAVIVGLSRGVEWGLTLATTYADRVLGAVFIGPSIAPHPSRIDAARRFIEPYPESPQGWEKNNARFWLDHYDEFVEFFFEQCFSEPHSTKQREDCVRWAQETSPEVLLADAPTFAAPAHLRERAKEVRVPTLVIHGDDDHISAIDDARELAHLTGGDFVVIEGGGHIPLARDPVRVNLLLRDFVERITGAVEVPPRWTRGRSRRKRALYISSPIGLGHARRDIAVARELRALHPDLEIEWLAQDPVTRALEAEGEYVHPASAELSSETAHLESESGEHDLHCFQAWRRMDEILLADFMTFHDVVTSRDYDLVIGDEAWDVDYFLHENPELKRFAYCWFTDFVGWLPMPDGGDHEVALTADYNAEMIEHIARYPRVRDAALFVGDPADIVPHHFGPGLPLIRDWTVDHYDFPGYITGFEAESVADRAELRASLGYRDDERVCIVAVGGSGVGGALLQRAVEAHRVAAARVPGLRTIVVTGPRIDPASLRDADGVDVRSYIPDLHRHLASCDVAVVQGGLTTCMELTATARPFVYVPLRHHFEQNFHVSHRLDRYGAGRRVDYAHADPDLLGTAIADEIGRDIEYAPVATDGARRAAEVIAQLL